jgi:acyl carrier protein
LAASTRRWCAGKSKKLAGEIRASIVDNRRTKNNNGLQTSDEEKCMIDQEIINKINKVFEESFEIEKERLVPQAHIFTDLGLDSLDIVDLVVALQNAFGVKIRNEEKVRDIRTLQDIYQFISSLKNEEHNKSA